MASKRVTYVPQNSTPLRCKLPNLTLMLLGQTGSGKSSLGNAVLELEGQEAFVVTDGMTATQIYTGEQRRVFVHERFVKVVDTPGVHDMSVGGEDQVLKGIGDGITRCPEGVDAFLIVLRLDVRFTDGEFDAVSKLERLFGPNVWRHVILVFTHGDSIQNDAARFYQSIESAKAKIPNFQKVLSKVKTKPIMIDASPKREQAVVKNQVTCCLMHSIDMLVRENKDTFTSEMFVQARMILEEENTQVLEEQRDRAHTELMELRKKISDLEKMRDEDH